MIPGIPEGCSSDELTSSVLSGSCELLTSAIPVFHTLLSDTILNPYGVEFLT